MRGLEKFVSLRFLLTVVFIALGAFLHEAGHVGFSGMLIIMMLPNIVFIIIRVRNRNQAR
ncbi:hypothetical protein E1573_19085 [Pseudomonas sp. H9]|nr:hypothetical protein E1573_19085 [Pseudomonas sp. H9]